MNTHTYATVAVDTLDIFWILL